MLALGYFTFKDLMHDRWRSLLTIISLAVVVAGYLLLASLSRAFLTVGKQSQVTNNLVILSADAIDPMESSLDEESLARQGHEVEDKVGDAVDQHRGEQALAVSVVCPGYDERRCHQVEEETEKADRAESPELLGRAVDEEEGEMPAEPDRAQDDAGDEGIPL